MKIQHIYHSGFLLEMDRSILLFDWYKGRLPELSPDKKLFVFCSHAHEDHYSPAIWDLQKIHPHVTYILDEGIADACRHPEAYVVTVKPRKTYQLEISGSGCRQIRSADGLLAREEGNNQEPEEGKKTVMLMISTLTSTDMGVAFCVETEGKRIYHAGDLNIWFWNDEPAEDNLASEKKCRDEMQALAHAIRAGRAACGKRTGAGEESGPLLDAAFIPLDPRLEEHGSRCLAAFMEILGAELIFPMHYWDREAEARAFLRDERLVPYLEKGQKISFGDAVL